VVVEEAGEQYLMLRLPPRLSLFISISSLNNFLSNPISCRRNDDRRQCHAFGYGMGSAFELLIPHHHVPELLMMMEDGVVMHSVRYGYGICVFLP